MKDYFPHSAYEEFAKNTDFIQALWQATQHIMTTSPLFKNNDVQAYRLLGIGQVDYLIVDNKERVFIVAQNKDKNFKEELQYLKQNYTNSVYFDLTIVGFTNVELHDVQALEYFMKHNEMKRMMEYSLSGDTSKLVVNPGELCSMNVHLDIIQDFVKTLQYHQIFPQGDIHQELEKIGQTVASKNDSEDFLPFIENIFSKLSDMNIQYDKALACRDGQMYLGEVPNTFILEEKQNIGLVGHYENNTWNIFSYFKIGQYNNATDILEVIKNNDVDIVRDVLAQFTDGKMTYAGGSLLNLHLDLYSASEFIQTEHNTHLTHKPKKLKV